MKIFFRTTEHVTNRRAHAHVNFQIQKKNFSDSENMPGHVEGGGAPFEGEEDLCKKEGEREL